MVMPARSSEAEVHHAALDFAGGSGRGAQTSPDPIARRGRRLTRAALWTVLALAAAAPASAQDRDWDGETNTLWSTGSNWDPNGEPSAIATATIDSGALSNQPTLNVDTTVTAVNISSGTLTVDATLTSSVTMSGTGNLTINVAGGVIGTISMGSSGTLVNNGTITGNLSITDGVTNNAGVVTNTTFVSGGLLRLNDGTNLSNSAGLSIGGGTVSVLSTETVGFLTLSGGTLGGSSELRVVGSFSQLAGVLAIGLTVNAAGDKTLEGGTIAGALEGAGATTVQSGTTLLSGTISGLVSVASGELDIDGTGSIGGAVEIDSLGHFIGGTSGTVVGTLKSLGRFTPDGLNIEGDMALAESARLFGGLNGLVINGVATLDGELNFDSAGVDFSSGYVEAEVFRADSIVDDFATFTVAGPAGFDVGYRIEDTGAELRYLITYTRIRVVPEPSSLALVLLAMLAGAGATRRWRTR